MTVKNNLNELNNIYDELEKIAGEYSFSTETLNSLCLCMDEIFSNIVNYAYDDGGEHLINISFDYNVPLKKMRIIIVDDGKPFNPLESEEPDLELDLSEREIGGLGIFIVTNIMTCVEYSRIKNENRLEMIKIVQ